MKTALMFFIFISSLNDFAQSPSWHTLPNSPSTNWRHDDLSFINENTGWVVYNTGFGGGNKGKVYKTTDGGNSWTMQFNVNDIYLRCIAFTDSLKGYIGTLGNINGLGDRNPVLYKTTNGGLHWDSVSFITNRPMGLCGMSTVGSNNIFACGRVTGPPYFVKSTDGGITWVSVDMSAYSSQLVDCKFFSPDSGFAVGAIGNINNGSKTLILFTSDGGNNWTERFHGNENTNYSSCWKVTFPDRNTGYASMDNENDTLYIIKTTNGGTSWQKINIYSGAQPIFTQGIGFINSSTGWVGGDVNYTFKTTNSGLNWQYDNFGNNINRIRFLNDSIGFAVGKRVYKFTSEPIGIQPISTEIPRQFSLYQNYPNPFNPETKIKFEIPFAGTDLRTIRLTIYNALGQEVKTLVNEQLKTGIYEVNWNASDYPSGVYFYKLVDGDNINNGGFAQTKKLVLLK